MAPERSGMKTFFIIWAGQLLSMLGSGMTGFAIGIWIFKRTGSATQFAMVALAATLPAVLISPLAGALVDRWDRRTVMIVSDIAAACTTLVLAALLWVDCLQLWHILAMTALGSCFGSFQGPAYQASVTMLVPKEHFGRASGLAQMARALGNILSPLLAGALIMFIGLRGIIIIDFATFLFALGTLLAVRIPSPPVSEDAKKLAGSIWRESFQGWTYIRERSGLLAMLILFAMLNFILGMVSALNVPMMLSFTTEARMGAIISMASVGMLIGSIVMSAWGGSQRRVPGIMVNLFFVGLGVAVVGLRAHGMFVIAGYFLAMFCVPLAGGCAQVIWQNKVPADIQGRVFATRGMVSMAMMPVAYLISGPLADRVFTPMLLEGGRLADSVGRVIGVGPGRGIGFMFVLAGLLVSFTVVIAYLNPRLRNVEDELPDMNPDQSAELDQGVQGATEVIA
ncbi:MAG: MFS transporter [bacterium]|nr:MFS transporter [bacterium]